MAFEPLEVEVREVEETESAFRRGVALAIATVTLFGALVVYLDSRANAESDRASRDAQRAAATNSQSAVAGQSRFDAAYGVYTESAQIQQQQVVTNTEARKDIFSANQGLAAHLEAEAAQWKEVVGSLASLSPLLHDDRFSDATDPQFPSRFLAETTLPSQVDDLRQKVDRQSSARWSTKAGHFGGVISLLAVMLFLLGLSLATPEKVRRVLVVPAAIIGAWCLFSAIKEASNKVPTVSDHAITLVAAGNQLVADLQFDAGIDEYTQAIKASPSFALAYGARSKAHFEKGAHIVPGQAFFAFSDPNEVTKAVADGEAAMRLGARDDVASVDSYGAVLFHARRYNDASKVEQQVIALNPDDPLAWTNLAADRVALGDANSGERAMRTGIEKMNTRPAKFERDGLYGGILSVLEILAKKEPSQARLIDRFRNVVVEADIQKELGGSQQGEPSASDFRISFSRERSSVDFSTDHVAPGMSLAVFWYIRQAPDRPFEEAPTMTTLTHVSATDPVHRFVVGAPPRCEEGGDYRADVYINSKFVGSAAGTRPAPSFGSANYLNDKALGALFCRPLGWTKISEPGFSLEVKSPDGKESLTVTDLPLPPGYAADAATLQALAIAASGRDPANVLDRQPMRISNFDGQAALFANDNGGQTAVVAIGLPASNDAKLVFLSAPSDPIRTLADMIDSLDLRNGS